MVREIVSKGNKYDATEPAYKEFAGLSTDAKPEERVLTGSLFLEVDTGEWYAFDEESGDWTKIAGGS